MSEVEYLDSREHSDQNQQLTNGYGHGGQQQPNFSRQQNYQQSSFFQGSTTNPLDISDDDLPF